ncbi:MAG: ADOP family duplicated permease [Acidobacteriota bacterium]
MSSRDDREPDTGHDAADIDRRIRDFVAELLRDPDLPPDLVEEARGDFVDHLRSEIRELRERGHDLDEAFRRAERRFGPSGKVRAALRDAARARQAARLPDGAGRSLRSVLDSLVQDLTYGFRRLRREPLFTGAAVVTLAVGIGASVAIFGLVHGVLLEPLPYEQPERLYSITYRMTDTGREMAWVSIPDFVDWRAQSGAFQEMAAADWPRSFNLTGSGNPRLVRGARVTPGFFEMLGVTPRRGRSFDPGDDAVAMLAHELWESGYGADPDIVGREIRIDGVPRVVAGVLPPVELPVDADVFVPVPGGFGVGDHGRRTDLLRVFGRLSPGIEPGEARAEMAAIAERLARRYPETNAGYGVAMTSLHESMLGHVETPLLLLLGSVGLVLLLATANVANLLMARSVTRRREVSVRSALGASRWRLVRQLITESLVLSTLGGIAGLLTGAWMLRSVLPLLPADLPRVANVGVDLQVAAFTIVVSLVVGVAFGLLPGRISRRPDLRGILQGESRGSVGSSAGAARGLLVVAEVAVTVVLLMGAGLLVRSLGALAAVEPGFRGDGLLTARLSLPDETYPDEDSCIRFYESLLERIATVSDVASVALTSAVPLSGTTRSTGYHVRGGSGEDASAQLRAVSAGYFRTMGIPLLRGRAFDGRDDRDAPAVLMVNRALAEELSPDGDATGEFLSLRGPDGPWIEVVGVVDAVRHVGLDRPPLPTIYSPYPQRAWDTMSLVIRHGDDSEGLVAAVREQARRLDSDLPVFGVVTGEALLRDAAAEHRFLTTVLSLFAAVAVLLAAVGIYGVLAYWVRHRSREIGVRMALGASRPRLVRAVLRQGLVKVGVGLGIGLALAVALGRTMGSVLYGVTPTDGPTMIGVAACLGAVAVAAALVPAWRAARLDPVRAMRE